jgi:hypothetical protein
MGGVVAGGGVLLNGGIKPRTKIIGETPPPTHTTHTPRLRPSRTATSQRLTDVHPRRQMGPTYPRPTRQRVRGARMVRWTRPDRGQAGQGE